MSHLDNPSALIKNQNTSVKNAEKLNLKTRETIISSAHAAFSNEWLGVFLRVSCLHQKIEKVLRNHR